VACTSGSFLSGIEKTLEEHKSEEKLISSGLNKELEEKLKATLREEP
jgi:hypothetical protein